ncbi:hypothetical protein [Rhodococcus sp. B10]|uniref:hypothetical protein n=1 Tax=Rhodococcus sp. B10 TaxID=2695876 RepID=UPI00142F4738|nr:hypothetical protein [Rhodococcus sp. B10]NIL77155.1 hypothetical protein [Rhodococcus sp. B10]
MSKETIKVGDLVYYNGFDGKRYWCVVYSIEGDGKDRRIWGNWRNSVSAARRAEPSRYGFMPYDEVFIDTKGEEVKPYQRKTYKQLKDSVTVKKDALWQEACDDGDQEYVLLDKSFSKDTAGNGVHKIYTRSLVEEDPKNFVEVFKVDPEYQTREELDLFEEFKKSRAKVRVAKPAAKRVVRKVKKAA